MIIFSLMINALVLLNLGSLSEDFLSKVSTLAKILNKELIVVGKKAETFGVKVAHRNITVEEAVEELTPYAFVLKKESHSPIEFLFKKPEEEILVENHRRKNFLLFREDFNIPERIIAFLDIGKNDKNYLTFLRDFANRLGAEVRFVFVLDESDEVFPLLEKEFQEAELEELLNDLILKRELEEIRTFFKGLRFSFSFLKGEAGAVVPYFAERENFDMLTVPSKNEHLEEFVENCQISLGVIYGLTED